MGAAFVIITGIALLFPALRFVKNDDLNQAALTGDIGRCDNLLSNGPSINGAGMHAMKPIMSAAKGGSLETVKFLVSRGADVNGHNDSGSTLMWAVDANNEQMVQFLLTNGADPAWKNWTVLDFAHEKRATNLVHILESWHVKSKAYGAANGSQPNRPQQRP